MARRIHHAEVEIWVQPMHVFFLKRPIDMKTAVTVRFSGIFTAVIGKADILEPKTIKKSVKASKRPKAICEESGADLQKATKCNRT